MRPKDERNKIIRGLRELDPQRWTYAALARRFRVSTGRIAHILNGDGESTKARNRAVARLIDMHRDDYRWLYEEERDKIGRKRAR